MFGPNQCVKTNSGWHLCRDRVSHDDPGLATQGLAHPPGRTSRKSLWTGKASRPPVSAVAKEERSEMREIIRKHLDNKGYVVRLTTHREGDNLIGRVHVTDASSDDTVAKLVGVGKVDHLELVFGVDASEGIARDLVNQVLNLAEFIKYMVPSVSVKEE